MKLRTKYIWCEIKKYYVLRELKRIPVGYGMVAVC